MYVRTQHQIGSLADFVTMMQIVNKFWLVL